MPCRTEYTEYDRQEREAQIVAGHLIYAFTTLNQQVNITPQMKKATQNPGNFRQMLNTWTSLLCSTLSNLTPAEQDAVLYNGRESKSRQIAEWWETHQIWDMRRKKEEDEEREKERIKKRKESLLKAFYTMPEDGQDRLLKSLGLDLNNL